MVQILWIRERRLKLFLGTNKAGYNDFKIFVLINNWYFMENIEKVRCANHENQQAESLGAY
jgi:hypothetical protein